MSRLIRVYLVASALLLGAIVYAGGGRGFERLLLVGVPATLALFVLWFMIDIEAGESRRAVWLGPLAYLGAVGGCVVHATLVAPSFPELEAEGAQLVRELERHREREGEYPVALPESCKTPVAEPFGGWDYERDFARFHLSVGDYARDGFTLYYDARGGWSLDT